MSRHRPIKSGDNTSTIVLPLSHSRRAIKLRQDKVKRETANDWINLYRLEAIAKKFSHDSRKYIGKAFERRIAYNAMTRESEPFQVWHTLVKGVTPIRHKLMTRAVAREWNRENAMNHLPLKWVLGRQVLQAEQAHAE